MNLAEQIDKVDRHYAAQLKKIDDYYSQKVDVLLERIELLQGQVSDLSARVQRLEHGSR